MNDTHPTIEQLVDYVHHELSAADDAGVGSHLATCEPCSQTHADELALSRLLRAHARAQERELPPGLIARIHDAIERERPVFWWQRWSAALRPAVVLPVAAAIAIAIFFGVTSWRGRTVAPTTIDAAYYLEDHAALATTTPFGEESDVPATLTSDDAVADQETVDETP